MDIQSIKQRFEIIGNSPLLDRAIDTAMQVAPTDISVLINGESGVGKETFPKIIHQLSSRKHGAYIAVNCGAIPEGTIDSELFGHEKGSFTGAHESRKGYFEVADGGTIFLDEVAELPLSTQVRLLRVLESGEFMKVGSSKVHKTDVRIVAATNVDMPNAISEGKFRQDLYYRLSTVPIYVPPLKDRGEDILLLFRKFAADFAEKYRMPVLRLTDEARQGLKNYCWPGNVRQLKNITEQISIIEKDRNISLEILQKYLPEESKHELPVLYSKEQKRQEISDRDLLYKFLFEMKKDMNDMKRVIADIIADKGMSSINKKDREILKKQYEEIHVEVEDDNITYKTTEKPQVEITSNNDHEFSYQESEVVEESLSLQKNEVDMIIKALERHNGKRKAAANDLEISERTLYRKIKEHGIKL